MRYLLPVLLLSGCDALMHCGAAAGASQAPAPAQDPAACRFAYQEAVRVAAERRDSKAMNELEYKLRSGALERECGR